MKIAVNAANREAVYKALDAAGYKFYSHGKEYDTTPAFFTRSDDKYVTVCSTEGYFKAHANPEHFLHNGEFLTAEQMAAKPPLKNIKVRVTSGAPAKDIVAALEKMGYEFYDEHARHAAAELGRAVWIYGNHTGLIGTSYTDSTEGDYEECFLYSGQLVPVDYFKQPVTFSGTINSSKITITGHVEEPAPFLSRQMYEAPRMKYLAECFLKTVEAGNKVPVEWIEEFAEHNSRLQDNYDVY
jgi:hypothetical protein